MKLSKKKSIKSIICLGLFALPVIAKSEPSITLQNEKSAIDVAPPYRSKEPKGEWLDFGVSSWSPKELSIPTSNVGSVSLKATGLDYYFNYTYQFSENSKEISGKLGINWRQLEFDYTSDTGGFPIVATQSSQLVSIRVGAEYDPLHFSSPWFNPYLGVSLLPSFIFTGRGGADPGSTYFGLPVDVNLGVRMALFSGWFLDLSAIETLGSINGSSASAFGLNGGLRVTL